MSERDAWRTICMMEYRISGDMQRATALADEITKDIARELAEKIRNHWVPKEGQTATYMCGLDDGLDIAADLIDPRT